jgi:hypothetical protein
MEGIAIHAASTESARGMLAALARFNPELVEAGDGRCQVVISLDGDDCEIVAVLGALEEYVTERATGPMRLELDGRRYVMQPDGGAETSVRNRGDGGDSVSKVVDDLWEEMSRETDEGDDQEEKIPASDQPWAKTSSGDADSVTTD